MAYETIRFTKHGFSLVELSIVLVILGLLVGGVLTGQSLIKASQLRKVSTDTNNYRTAVLSFRDKYFALPGDMTNATAFWGLVPGGTGAADGTDTTCYTTASTDASTCNGNGDGLISSALGAGETGRAWQHLANAGLIAGSYPGNYAVSGGLSPAGNVPALALSNGYVWLTNNWSMSGGGANFFVRDISFNYFIVGAYPYFGTGGGRMPGLLLASEDAWNIDTKLDDGLPQTGRIFSAGRVLTGGGAYSKFCAVDNTSTGNAYQFDSSISSGAQCILAFRVS